MSGKQRTNNDTERAAKFFIAINNHCSNDNKTKSLYTYFIF